MFEEERNHIRTLIVNQAWDVIWINLSDKIKVTNCSNLELRNNSVLVNQSDDPLWTWKDKNTTANKRSSEEVKGWFT